MNIFISITTNGQVYAETMMRAHRLAVRHNAALSVTKGTPHDYSANMAVVEFLKSKCEWMFCLEYDIDPPLDAIDKLLSLNEPLCCGIYPIAIESGLCWAIGNEEKKLFINIPKEPFEASFAGVGCMLVHRKVFEKIGFPWFLWGHKVDGSQTSPDVFFFDKCKEAGFRLMVNPHVLCGHYKNINITNFIRKD